MQKNAHTQVAAVCLRHGERGAAGGGVMEGAVGRSVGCINQSMRSASRREACCHDA